MNRQFNSKEDEDDKNNEGERLLLGKGDFYPLARRGEQIELDVEYHVLHSLKT